MSWRSPLSAPDLSSLLFSGGYTATRLWSKSAGVISLEAKFARDERPLLCMPPAGILWVWQNAIRQQFILHFIDLDWCGSPGPTLRNAGKVVKDLVRGRQLSDALLILEEHPSAACEPKKLPAVTFICLISLHVCGLGECQSCSYIWKPSACAHSACLTPIPHQKPQKRPLLELMPTWTKPVICPEEGHHRPPVHTHKGQSA